MNQANVGLRPTTVRILDALVAAGDAAVGLTFEAIATHLGVAQRSVRRALCELENGSFIRCSRTSERRKYVLSVECGNASHPALPRVVALKTAQNVPKRPNVSAQNVPKRPKKAQPQASIEQLFKGKTSGGCKSIASRAPRPEPAKPPPQQLLALEGSDDASDRARVADALRRLDQIVRGVWRSRGGKVHGFFCADDRTNIGLAAALRRYEWDVIADVVRWSAEQLADGRLKAAFFATTFRGSAFCKRHSDWEAWTERAQRLAVRSAERAASADAAPSGAYEDAETIERLTASCLQRIRGL